MAKLISYKHFVHFSPPNAREEMSAYLDNFWFRLGYRDCTTIVVSAKSHDVLTRLCEDGLLYDLRSRQLPLYEGTLYDLLHEILTGKHTRIQACNSIRDSLSVLPGLRWCGAESESLFHPNIYKNAYEICGNAPPGKFFSCTLGVTGELPTTMHEDHLISLYDGIVNEFEEPGQRKLGLIALAIPRSGYNLIYVGGSPGCAWIRALELRNFSGKIISIDPEPLLISPDTVLNVKHVTSMIHSVDDIARCLDIVGEPDLSNVIFVWDVRHSSASTMENDERNDVIREEIANLNSIISSNWFREHVSMYQLKINTTNIQCYELPTQRKFYVQPFTFSRNVYELRAIGYTTHSHSSLLTLSDDQLSSLSAFISEFKDRIDSSELSEYILFLNFITSIYRECDYIDEPPLIKPVWEIALYTLNWNSDSKLRRYFRRISNDSVRFIGSFFLKTLLAEGEYAFPEHILLREFPSMVFDSRALIKAKIEGLYLFANTVVCRCMHNETVFSESYLIRSTEYGLHRSGKMPLYDEARTKESAKIGHVFAKFPNIFSANENLISPSGHSLRMFIEYVRNNASLCMFVYKIISNFLHVNGRRINEQYREMLFPSTTNSWIYELSSRISNTPYRLERADDALWHKKTQNKIDKLEKRIPKKTFYCINNKRSRSNSCDSDDYDSDGIPYAESDDSTYFEEDAMLEEIPDIEELEINDSVDNIEEMKTEHTESFIIEENDLEINTIDKFGQILENDPKKTRKEKEQKANEGQMYHTQLINSYAEELRVKTKGEVKMNVDEEPEMAELKK
ncbi:unnamed protein product [Arctia plantaginis]|uniref:Uncharacterized protein n=1 Tax=Arctia plantaginis TaxID=874455 RepID=A0A8S1B4E1_ARCPL|nr:unnamed protein product [Arctia plantaginis]